MALIRTDSFYCRHITDDDKEIIKGFTLANDQGGYLSDYLKYDALQEEECGKARTYLVFTTDKDELVAYFSLKAGFVSVSEYSVLRRKFQSVPGVEISNFAVNGKSIEKYPDMKGVGAIIFKRFIYPTIKNASEYIGITLIYIFALPRKSLINRYKTYGFSRLNSLQESRTHKRIRPMYDEGCIFMYRML